MADFTKVDFLYLPLKKKVWYSFQYFCSVYQEEKDWRCVPFHKLLHFGDTKQAMVSISATVLGIYVFCTT